MQNRIIIKDFLHYLVFEKKGCVGVKIYRPIEKPRTFGRMKHGENGSFVVIVAREAKPLVINILRNSFKFTEENFLENRSLLITSKNSRYLINQI